MQRTNGPTDSAAVARLDFLMRYLGWRVGERLARTIAVLDTDLGYTIPTTLPDPDGRAWQDPRERDLYLVIHAERREPPRTHGFTISGQGPLAGLALHSCGADRRGGLCWTTAVDLPETGPGRATARVLDALWALPGWHARSSFDFEWLEPGSAAERHRSPSS